jgi:hypothetical protein
MPMPTKLQADGKPWDGHYRCEYIGDGVYASWDGYQIWVHAERHPVWHSVAIEVSTMSRLLDFTKVIKDLVKSMRED